MSSKVFWAYFDKDTVVQTQAPRGYKSYTFQKKTKARVHQWKVEKDYFQDKKGDIITYGCCMETGGRFEVPKGTKYTIINISPLSKEFVGKAVAGSEWEFIDNFRLIGYDKTPLNFKKGTKLVIIQDRMKLNYYFRGFGEIKCFVAKIGNKTLELPAQEVSSHLNLVNGGKTKTYWRLLDKDGNKVSQKRFKNLGAVKASVRVRLGLVKTGGHHYWLENARPESFRDWAAVEYDYTTNKELNREELKDWVFIQKI